MAQVQLRLDASGLLVGDTGAAFCWGAPHGKAGQLQRVGADVEALLEAFEVQLQVWPKGLLSSSCTVVANVHECDSHCGARATALMCEPMVVEVVAALLLLE